MRKTTLVVMAAGMGSRFGGLKQIEPVGPNGEVILDYSIFDAKQAGFDKVVFIIKKEIEKDFRNISGKRIEKIIDVDYVFQGFDDMPQGRTKPWGTAHAVLCARDVVNSPFAVINADDYYGKTAYKKLYESDGMCLVGFLLQNTLTENGTVARGICEIESGYLKGVTEHTAIDKNSGFSLNTIVSMNMWGFLPSVFDDLQEGFDRFLIENKDQLKGEYFLPMVVDDLIKNRNAKFKMLSTDEKWYGVTYKEDKAAVSEAIKNMMKEGLYEGI